MSGNHKQRLAIFDRLTVLNQYFFNDARFVSFDLIEQFHGFNDAKGITLLYRLTNFNERRSLGP